MCSIIAAFLASGLALTSLASTLQAQSSAAEQVQVSPPVEQAGPPPEDWSAEQLEEKGDSLRAEKSYLDALDYYRAGLKKQPSAQTYNKIGITELHLGRFGDASKDFKRAVKADHAFADAVNNLGAVYYYQRSYKNAVKQYQRAIKLRPDSATFYCNLGAALFARKETEKAIMAYVQALQLDPMVLERSSRTGVQSQTAPSADERAHYHYLIAKAYAKLGLLDRAFENLKKAREEQYKDFGDVYKDQEFAALRKDPRFTEMMAAKIPLLE